jgi:hypothetical protein
MGRYERVFLQAGAEFSRPNTLGSCIGRKCHLRGISVSLEDSCMTQG